MAENADAGNRRKLYLQAAALFAAISNPALFLFLYESQRHTGFGADIYLLDKKPGNPGFINREWSNVPFLAVAGKEAPILLLGATGNGHWRLFRARNYLNRLLRILGPWESFAGRTPLSLIRRHGWFLSIILPLTIMAGYLIGEAYKPGTPPPFTVVIAGLAIFVFSLPGKSTSVL